MMTRREVLNAMAGMLAVGMKDARGNARQTHTPTVSTDTCAHRPGLCVAPGQWRPWFESEQIAWIRTPWSDQLFPDCIWLDFPEAIFSREGLWYLSHVNPHIPSKFSGLPRVPWLPAPGGIAFERTLPNGIILGGRVLRANDTTVNLDLFIRNDSEETLTDVTLQTCAYLKPSGLFSEPVQSNKLVHTSSKGWVPMNQAATMEPNGRYRVGWRGGPAVADKPVVLTRSRDDHHWVAMTWLKDTYSLIGNPAHPCMHADPSLGTLQPGQHRTIKGRITFFQGTLKKFIAAYPLLG
jgi:hypothetical protein